MSKRGFTLIELMIVIAVIAIIAAIAIPSLLRSQMSSNETAAIGALRTLVASQSQFKGATVVDQDSDGTGEYGYFQELTGTATPRTVGAQVPSNVRAGEYITQVLGNVNAGGVASKSSFQFYMYLPDDVGGTVGESNPLPAGNANYANNQESRFICYAWPVAWDSSGKWCFVVNQQGEVFQARNENAGVPFYNGPALIPAADAAIESTFPNSANISGPFPKSLNGEVGVDTQQWNPAGQ